jgi:LysM repeat protein
MNEKKPNPMNLEDEKLAQKLSQVAEQTHANAQFAAELEERLRNTRQAKPSWFAVTFRQVSPALRWAAFMILLAVVLSWSIKTLIPAPQPATDNTPVASATSTPTSATVIDQTATPILVEQGAYDWRGTKLHLATSLPESPSEANVLVIQPEQPTTLETVRALADQFGMQGEIFEIEPEPNAPSGFSVVDGSQRLNVRSDRYFEYIPDVALMNSENPFSLSNPNAEAIIDEFMQSHNFNFLYRIVRSELYQGFYVQALTPDGLSIHHEFFEQDGLLFHLNDTQIVYISASLPRYDQVGIYEIKSAEEAFQQVVADMDFNGMIGGVHSSGKPPQTWKRSYPVNETVTVYGFMNVMQSVSGQPSLVSIDSFLAKGNLAGAETLEKLTLVKATGQFILEDGERVFNVESWEVFKQDGHGFSGKDAFLGTLQQQGRDVIVVAEKGTFILPDVPADVPLPLENAYVYGMALGDVFEWEGIEYRAMNEDRGGGGGSSGNGFYKLNLSGAPVLSPTPTALPQIDQVPGTYIVQEGEHCGIIGEKFGVSIQSIIDQNQLSADCLLTVGQTLVIPDTTTASNDVFYIVQENDTVASIALNFGISVEELKQANDLPGDGLIHVGQRLFIPGQQTENSLIGRRFEKQRGILVITFYKQPDGNTRTEFVFLTKNEVGSTFHALLENVSFEALRSYHNLPLDIWGTVERVDQNGTPIISLERYEAPFPGLHIQFLEGKQRLTEVDGEQVILFTATDGTTYAQMLIFGAPDTTTIVGNEGDEVLLESLAVPGETFGGYPTLYVFGAGMATNANDQPLGMEISADEPYVVDEMNMPGTYIGPAATIENVELVYYVPNSRYTPFPEGSDAEYIQPAWRFHGHYEDGKEFVILIQALKQEYLLPELAPFTRPG